MGKQPDAVMWKPEEMARLLALSREYPSQWKRIGKLLRRSGASVRNCFQRIDPSRVHRGKNLCTNCGLFKRGHVCLSTKNPPNNRTVTLKLRGEDHVSPLLLDIVIERLTQHPVIARSPESELCSVKELATEWELFAADIS
jgi:hypothetical protein